ncbi:MAG: hydroxymethylbilane synthase [Deltaproteobacteria bacterium]|nr:hydroxymethylbilane synthase [Deltaproteobacteria bacterium]
MSLVRIATRGSALALAQSGQLGRRIEAALGVEVELVTVRTTGDRIQDRSLAKVGGKGLFVKEVEEALLEGRADLAVHSAKDLPAELAPGLGLAAIPARADCRDALIGRVGGTHLEGLPRGARVGTGSVRRKSQLLAHRPDLVIRPLRGNVDTRLRKLEEEGLDAVVLACAGLDRLSLEERIHERLDPSVLLPCAGQGTLAIEAREEGPLFEDLAALDDAAARFALTAERAFVGALSGDCHAPIAALAVVRPEGRVQLRGRVLATDGGRVVAVDASGAAHEALALGRGAAEEALGRGAEALIAKAREEALA